MSGPIVVDTMIASAWLGKRQSQRRARWAPLVESSVWVLPFVVVAEMRTLRFDQARNIRCPGWGPSEVDTATSDRHELINSDRRSGTADADASHSSSNGPVVAGRHPQERPVIEEQRNPS